MSKYYFENEDSEMSYSKEFFQNKMEERELTEMEVFEANISYGNDFFYCKEFQEVGEVRESCGKVCDKYEPNNGKNGRCKHYGYVYEKGNKVTLKSNKCNHKLIKDQLSYLGWFEWAEKKTRRGAKQTQCPKCGQWLFKCEK